jgi:hypothetical protein
LHIECLRSSYKAPHLRAIAAALTEAADKLEPKAEPAPEPVSGLLKVRRYIGDGTPDRVHETDTLGFSPGFKAVPKTPDTIAWWEAYLAALTGLCAHTGSYGLHNGPSEIAARAAEIATAAVEALRKMENSHDAG